MLQRLLCVCMSLCFILSAEASDIQIPDPLKPWKDWVLEEHSDRVCPFEHANSQKRQCLWPTELSIDIYEGGASFSQTWFNYHEGWAPLPGDKNNWPLNVTINQKNTTVLTDNKHPRIWLTEGKQTITGEFLWTNIPEYIHIPKKTGLINVTESGSKITLPQIDSKGRFWLKKKASEDKQENALNITVHRLLEDGIPIQLKTLIQLEVSGQAREVKIGKALLENFEVTKILSSIPTRIENDGHIILQVRTGQWNIEVESRYTGKQSTKLPLSLAPETNEWPHQEIWGLKSNPQFRDVSVSGVSPIDARQTEFPSKWHQYPTYLLNKDSELILQENFRGDLGLTSNELSLKRTMWLDFSGSSFTVKDQITGEMNQNWRLNMHSPYELGQVELEGKPQLITQLNTSDDDSKQQSAGVELRQHHVSLESTSQLPLDNASGPLEFLGEYFQTAFIKSSIPIIGWSEDMQHVNLKLQLPPGWTLFSVFGSDKTSGAWLNSWQLWDIFIVLITAVAFFKLFGFVAGLLTLFTLTFTFHNKEAPQYLWLITLLSFVGWQQLKGYKIEIWLKTLTYVFGIFLVISISVFSLQQVRLMIFPQLESFARTDSSSLMNMLPTAEQRYSEDEAFDDAPYESQASYSKESEADLLQNSITNIRKKDSKINFIKDKPQTPLAIQTGPSIPTWEWQQAQINWNSPVSQDQELRMIIFPPWMTLVWRILQVILVINLLAIFWSKIQRSYPPSPPPTLKPKQTPQTKTNPLQEPISESQNTQPTQTTSKPLEPSDNIGSDHNVAKHQLHEHLSATDTTETNKTNLMSPSVKHPHERSKLSHAHQPNLPHQINKRTFVPSKVQNDPMDGLKNRTSSLTKAPQKRSPSPTKRFTPAMKRLQKNDSLKKVQRNKRTKTSLYVMAFLLFSLFDFISPSQSNADIPSAEMLKELEKRLLKSPACLPQCASINKGNLSLKDNVLTLRITVHSQEKIALPLPYANKHVDIQQVWLNGQSAIGMMSAPNKGLYIALEPGIHNILMKGSIHQPEINLNFPIKINNLNFEFNDWEMLTPVTKNWAKGDLQFSKKIPETEGNKSEALTPNTISSFLRIERTLQLGIKWQVITKVSRLAPLTGPIHASIPLIHNESIISQGIPVKNDSALISLGQQQESIEWLSTLPISEVIKLKADDHTQWVEVWKISSTEKWHIKTTGIQPLGGNASINGNQYQPVWTPWPGESLNITISEPIPHEGSTLTIDNLVWDQKVGQRITNFSNLIKIRSSQADNLTLTLPEDATIKSLKINGTDQLLRETQKELDLNIQPGQQTILLSWQMNKPLSWWDESPAFQISHPAHNVHMNYHFPQGRWLLWADGPILGPVVMFWPWLILVALLIIPLKRIKQLPLKSYEWILLAIGLSSTNLAAIIPVVAWFALIAWRSRWTEEDIRHAKAYWYNSIQCVIGLLTVIVLLLFIDIVPAGLLGRPDMQVIGNGSTYHDLHWFTDKITESIPTINVISLPLWAYQIIMLLWSLWLAFAVIRWGKWAWQQTSSHTIWKTHVKVPK